MSYILIILAVLVLLNTYPLLVSQSLVFRTKETAMKSSVKMVESALSGLPELTEENVGQALASVEETGVSRLLVTDTSGRILFDTREGGSAKGMYAMYTEIVQALDGSDAFYCRYDSHAFLSRGASPVVYRNRIIGAVYAYEYDTQQAELLQSFQTNLTRISLLIGVLVVALSALLSRAFTRKIRELLQAIRQVREGAYSHRASVRGNDEIAQLATEFNSLTDRLQTTEAARRRFVSDASHELKTPLTVILSSADLLAESAPAEEQTYVENIRAESRRMKKLVEEMLTLFRAESVRRETAFSEVDLSDVVTDAALRFEPVVFESGRRLLYTIDEGLQVSGDRDALERLTGILLDNAVKYAPQGTDIRLTLTHQDRTACLAVENGGDPIPPEVAAHLFDRFYRADSSRTGTGFGLGLAIARAIVQNHRGNIICRSQEGLNRFSVTLPVLRQKEAQ